MRLVRNIKQVLCLHKDQISTTILTFDDSIKIEHKLTSEFCPRCKKLKRQKEEHI